jgi:glucokinase
MSDLIANPHLFYAGVDLGGTKIALAIGTATGSIALQKIVDTQGEEGPEGVIQRIVKLLQDAEKEFGRRVDRIGVGVPGLVDVENGNVLFLPNLPGNWRGVPLRKSLEALTKRAVVIRNDARVATLGEFIFGAGRESQNLILVTVGTGVGGGLVLNGRLQLGRFGAAGEIGHHTILPDGEPCTCGSRGCLETLVSGPALVAEARKLLELGRAPHLKAILDKSGAELSPQEMAAAAKMGDVEVARAIGAAASYLGIGIANAVTITGIEHVVITGGLAALGDLILVPVCWEIANRVRMFPPDDVRVECSRLGNSAGTLGAIALAAGFEAQRPVASSTATSSR